MELKWTEQAIEKIEKTFHEGFLLLKHDTEGCGCVVSGVSALWALESEPADTIKIETNYVPVFIEKHTAVFFDEVMSIDFKKEQNTLQLKSPNQMLNPNLRFENKITTRKDA